MSEQKGQRGAARTRWIENLWHRPSIDNKRRARTFSDAKRYSLRCAEGSRIGALYRPCVLSWRTFPLATRFPVLLAIIHDPLT